MSDGFARVRVQSRSRSAHPGVLAVAERIVPSNHEDGVAVLLDGLM